MSWINQAFWTGLRRNEQPRCPYCGYGLELYAKALGGLYYQWDRRRHRYTRINFVEIERATVSCVNCGFCDQDAQFKPKKAARKLGFSIRNIKK